MVISCYWADGEFNCKRSGCPFFSLPSLFSSPPSPAAASPHFACHSDCSFSLRLCDSQADRLQTDRQKGRKVIEAVYVSVCVPVSLSICQPIYSICLANCLYINNINNVNNIIIIIIVIII